MSCPTPRRWDTLGLRIGLNRAWIDRDGGEDRFFCVIFWLHVQRSFLEVKIVLVSMEVCVSSLKGV